MQPDQSFFPVPYDKENDTAVFDIRLKDCCTPELFHHNMPVLFHKIRLLYLRYDGLMPA